ncbi:hypothetical protein PVAND_005577 [Polypedilum vanderplanki]|uniref:Uncharacterized protein n=1 Tax=Polypedilum vanderplanki TaxID=319348 RepID=A0A9J6C1G1_POLVA|nr:hypothetical protein PVAND_005577 [Polypedilum vanderplanki]
MAYINVNDWKCEQVIEWLKGIECVNNFYIKAFANNQIGGFQLLYITHTELNELGIKKIGHQELILEAVEHLKNFHFNLEKENLQYLALQVATTSTSLFKQLSYNPDTKLESVVLKDVAYIISKVKTLISWLDNSPFKGHSQYSEMRRNWLKLGLELATIAQRDRFVQNPIKQITSITQTLSKLSDYIIHDITDPMVLQPAFLDLVTLKKKESELGFYIMPNYQSIHRVTDIKYNSPAHNSGKVEDGDEIVQINYQTVIGWQYKKVLMQLQESTTDVLLTLKKRPKHSNRIYGHLGLIKLPSKKRSIPYRWEHFPPSPRIEEMTAPELTLPPAKKKEIILDLTDESSGESDVLTPTEIKSSDKELRLYLPKPRAAIQFTRRHTICGNDLRNFKNIGNLVLWHERKSNKTDIESNTSLRDKSVSISFGLNTRPSTCLGISENSGKIDRLKSSLPDIIKNRKNNTEVIHEQENENDDSALKTGVSKVVRFDSLSQDYNKDSQYTCNVEDTIIESFAPIPYVDDDPIVEIKKCDETNVEIKEAKSVQQPPALNPRTIYDHNFNTIVEAVNEVVIARETKRGRLDKSYSTPTYDPTEPTNELESIETLSINVPPRQQAVKIPPVPPRKQNMQAPHPPPSPFSISIEANDHDNNKSNIEKQKRDQTTPKNNNLILEAEIHIKKSSPTEISELHTLTKSTKNQTTLTSKKKKSLMAKRRKVTLKSLMSTAAGIQGHLYRRAKDKSEVAYWSKLYFVLVDTTLYGFKNKEAQKADCVVFLVGFTVGLASEVHSKEFAFKVYHPKKTLYLAAETSEAMTQWIDYIRQATQKGTTNLDCDTKELYSETECSDDDFDISSNKNQLTISSPGSQSQTSNDKSIEQTPPSSKHHHYHLNFGSLKKTFTRGSEGSSPSDNKFLGFFSSSKNEKKSTDIVQTAQFKTYKKVKEMNGGLQLGATSMINSNVSDMYLSSGIENFTHLSTDIKHSPPPQQEDTTSIKTSESSPSSSSNDDRSKNSSKGNLRKTHNFLHASNPNLLDFNFHHTIDFPINSVSSNTNWDLNGMTLLDFMNQQREEEEKDMYDKRVDQGFERSEDRSALKVSSEKPAIPQKPNSHIAKIQKRTLPLPPDAAQSFKPNDQAILYTRSKEGQKLRDFGYELISNDDDQNSNEKNNDIKLWASKSKRKVSPLTESLKKKTGFNWMMMSHDKEECHTNVNLGNSGSFRKLMKSNDEKTAKLQGASSSNMSSKNDNFSSIVRKNSVPSNPTSLLNKLSFSSSNTKEKKLLGSPKLHRAIFGRNAHSSTSSNISTQALKDNSDHEIFTPITFSKQPSNNLQPFHLTQHQNYPDLTLPPVFQQETYTLNALKNLKNE